MSSDGCASKTGIGSAAIEGDGVKALQLNARLISTAIPMSSQNLKGKIECMNDERILNAIQMDILFVKGIMHNPKPN